MHYKVRIYNESMKMDEGAPWVDAPTLPELRQRVDALHADSVHAPLTLGGFYRVEDNGTQVPLSEQERDEALGRSFGP